METFYGKLIPLFLCILIFVKDVTEGSKPKLDVPNEWVFETQRNETWTGPPLVITCTDDQPLEWHTQVDEEFYKVEENNSRGKYESIFKIKEALPEDTGNFSCSNQDGETSSTYVYVFDGETGFVMGNGHTGISAFIGEEIVLDCRTTRPDTKVKVLKDQKEDVTDEFSVDKFYRFTKTLESIQDNGIYTCKENYLNSEFNWVVDVQTNPNLPNPSIDKHQNTYYVVGVEFSLNCSVQSNDNISPKITWDIPNSDSESTESMTKTDSSLVSTLTVRNPSLKDSGNYTCVVQFGSQVKRDSRFINVTDHIDPFVEFNKEAERPSPLLVKEFGNFRWVRYFRGYPPELTYTFYDPLKRELNSQEGKVLIDYVYEEGKLCLEIKNVSAEDFGNYSLKIETPTGEFDKTSVILIVNATPKVEFVNPSPIYSFNEPANLTVNILSFSLEHPQPKVRSFLYTECPEGIGTCDRSQRKELNCSVTRRDGPLNRHKAEMSFVPERSGLIEIRALNIFGENTSSTYINVSDKKASFLVTIQTENGDMDLTKHTPKGKEIKIVEGDNVTVGCFSLNFIYDHLHISPQESVICDTELSSGRCLSINSVELFHNGSYECLARNKGTNVEETISFSFKVLEKRIPTIKKNSNVSLEGNEITVEAGNKFTLACLVDGLPKPSILWLKDGEDIETLPEFMNKPDRVILSEDKQNIEFKFAQMEYEGEYVCHAENRIGAIDPYASVVVEGAGLTTVQLSFIGLSIAFIVLLSGVVFFLIFRVKKESKLRNELRQNQLYLFEKGNVGDLNKECTIDEQANLLPYDKAYEVARERIKVGKQLGAGAFGRVMQADVEGLEEEGKVTRVAVKMCKDGADMAHLRALTLELKIMVHLGKHLNIVNLMGAHTSNMNKGDLWILVEYCKYGNLLKFIQKLKSRFINQVDPVTGMIDIQRTTPFPNDPLSPNSHGRSSRGQGGAIYFDADGYLEARSQGGSIRSNQTVTRQHSTLSSNDSASGTMRPGLYVGNPHYATAGILQEGHGQTQGPVNTPPPVASGEHYVMATELPSPSAPSRKESSVSSPSSEGVYHMTLNTEMTAISSPPPFSPSSHTSGDFFFDSQGNPVTFDSGAIPGVSAPFTTTDLICWAWQVANGMEYLTRRKVLHGDLAARNLLLAENNVVKISDFGLSRDMYKQDIYMKKGDEIMPIKWMAPEAIQQKVFSIQSDVWAYGITLWEMFTLGNTPYPGVPLNQEFPIALENGMRMEKPKCCNEEIYALMMDCWRHNPIERPSFTAIADKLSSLLSPESRDNYVAMNTVLMKKNEEWMQFKEDYLNMVTSPDFHNLISLEEEVREGQSYIQMGSVRGAPDGESHPSGGYLDMRTVCNPTPPDAIFSPRPPSENSKTPGESMFTFSGNEIAYSEDQQSPVETSNLLEKSEDKSPSSLRNNNNNISKLNTYNEQQQPHYQNLEKISLTKNETSVGLSASDDIISDNEDSTRNYMNIPNLNQNNQNYVNTSQVV